MKNAKQSAIVYIEKIRSSEKRRYAKAYYDYCEGVSDEDPSYNSTFYCNSMAKQAVRMTLACYDICPENRNNMGSSPEGGNKMTSSVTQYQAVVEALNSADHASAVLGLRIHLSEFNNPDTAKDHARALMEVLTAVLSENKIVDNGW